MNVASHKRCPDLSVYIGSGIEVFCEGVREESWQMTTPLLLAQ